MKVRSIIALLVLLIAAPILAEESKDGFVQKDGEALPYFASTALDGTAIGSRVETTALLLHFVRCESERCGESLRAVEEYIHRPLKDRGVRVAGVIVGATEEEARALAAEHGLTMPLIADPDGNLFHRFAKEGVPRTIIADRNGRIVYQHAGYSPGREGEWRMGVDMLLEGRALYIPGRAPVVGSGMVNPMLLAVDIRGERMIDVPVEAWVNRPPEDTQGKFILYDFWATWCGPCVEAMVVSEKVHHLFDDRLVTIAVSDEDLETVRAFVEKRSLKQPIGVDTKGVAKERLKIQGIPAAFLVNSDGDVVFQGHPMFLWANEGAELKKYLDGKADANASTEE